MGSTIEAGDEIRIRMVLLFSLALLFSSIWASAKASDCDSFMYGTLCLPDHLSDIIWTIPDLENEIKCQVECVETSGCKFFTFVEFTTGTTGCFLLRSCEANSTSACSNEPDCQMAVSGPVTPSLVDSCCDKFEEVQCDSQNEIGHEFNIFGEEACQQLCRDEFSCSYWTLFGEVCFFYSSCGTPTSCSSCTSGPAFPDMSTCASHQVQYTLLLGGTIPDNTYSTILEMITPNLVCSPNMPALPVERRYGSAALLGSTIFYCGGEDASTPNIHGTCHSYLLGKESARWEEEASMNYAKDRFSLTTIEDRLYATGGFNSPSYLTFVESFSHETGWVIEDTMELPSTRGMHCSVALGTRLFVLGGRVGNTVESSSVQAFDTSRQALNTTASWVTLASMNAAREYHACNTGDFEGIFGIYVAGGYTTAALNTVEFYSPVTDIWTNLATLGTARSSHSLTIVNGQMVVAGGYPGLITSVETLNGTEWIQTNNLKAGRQDHAAVSVPAGLLTCQMETV